MINITETPQYSNNTYDYQVKNDTLIIMMGESVEVFDFTDMPDGIAEDIEIEFIKVNPIVSVEKHDDIVDITLIRFYYDDEKELYEYGENQMEEPI